MKVWFGQHEIASGFYYEVTDRIGEDIVPTTDAIVVAASDDSRPGDDVAVTVDEEVRRGAGWLAARRKDPSTRPVHLAFARRADGLTRPEFAERWRAHAGSVGTTTIPEQMRGLAYAQYHPTDIDPDDDSADADIFDAMNIVWFDSADDLTARHRWLADQPAGALFAGRVLLTALEHVI